MPTLVPDCHPPPKHCDCNCQRASVCESCWNAFERSLTESQLREWLAGWDKRSLGASEVAVRFDD